MPARKPLMSGKDRSGLELRWFQWAVRVKEQELQPRRQTVRWERESPLGPAATGRRTGL
jgi:hypothetical protein